METLYFETFTIRRVNVNDTTWFCARDVCAILGYERKSYTTVYGKVDNDCKVKLSDLVADVDHNTGLLIYVNEYGLMDLVITCKLASAKTFKNYIKQTLQKLCFKTALLLDK